MKSSGQPRPGFSVPNTLDYWHFLITLLGCHMRQMPSIDRLKELLEFNPELGTLKWRHTGTGRKNTRLAGSLHGSYQRVKIDGHHYFAHRVMWALAHGSIDDSLEIDHLNGVKSDNRLCNLRLVSRQANMQNRRGANKGSKTGFLGVHPVRDKFRASIRLGKKLHHLGYFDSAAAAYSAYVDSKRNLHEGGTL